MPTVGPSSAVLMVPIAVEALILQEDQMAMEAFADFSKLPWTDGKEDHNSDVPNLSESILASPFGNYTLQLRKGTHIHWRLPKALSKLAPEESTGNSVADNGAIKAPNRWLISCYNQAGTLQSQQVVESDYVHPATKDTTLHHITIPAAALGPVPPGHPPFRYLGRTMEYTAWQAGEVETPAPTYWNHLTALGYGEPAFASFYPNCAGVFGHYEAPQPDRSPPTDVYYEVMGWYSDPANDPLYEFIQNQSPTLRGIALAEAIQDHFEWRYADAMDSPPSTPQQIVCYGRVTPQTKGTDSTPFSVEGILSETPSNALIQLVAEQIKPAVGGDLTVIEEQLESLSLRHQIDHNSPDFAADLAQARHKKGFTDLHGGDRFVIKARTTTTATASPPQAPSAEPPMPASLAPLLAAINEAQATFEAKTNDLITQKHQLFSDWNKYMVSSYPPLGEEQNYPDADRIRSFLSQEITTLHAPQAYQIGTLSLQTDAQAYVTGATGVPSGSYADVVAQAIQKLLTQLGSTDSTGPDWKLLKVPGERFYQPNEPVLMFNGDNIIPRLPAETDLSCEFFSVPDTSNISTWVNSLQGHAHTLLHSGSDSDQPSKSIFEPIFFEWEAVFYPVERSGDTTSVLRDYPANYVTANYALENNATELRAKPTATFTQRPNLFQGRSYVHAKSGIGPLEQQLQHYLEQKVVPMYKASLANESPPKTSVASPLANALPEMVSWAETSFGGKANNLPYVALLAYQKMQTMNPTTQILGGFHDALLMHQLTLQVGVSDPLGFADQQAFAAQVAAAIGDNIRSAPLPQVDFNPIRTGNMAISQLKVVDSFGFARSVHVTNPTVPNPQNLSFVEFDLPPRLGIPARLTCEWLSAQDPTYPITNHQDSSPVCGWLLPNILDQNLAVYDAAGNALGIMAANGWSTPPGVTANAVAAPSGIANPQLRAVVSYITHGGKEFLANFLATLESSLDSIQPLNSQQNLELALLMGRPIAVTQLQLGFEVQGDYPTDQSWAAFRNTLQGGGRSTRDLEQVEFPIRLGEYQLLNDGVLGYWKGLPSTTASSTFYAVQSQLGTEAAAPPMPGIEPHTQNPLTLTMALDDSFQTLTVLVDPRAKVHATTGILPTQKLTIPPSHYVAALQKIQVYFLTTPVLMGTKAALPISSEPGYSWAYVQQIVQGQWQITERQGVVTQDQLTAQFTKIDAQELWQQLLDHNWLTAMGSESPPTQAKIVHRDQRGTIQAADSPPSSPPKPGSGYLIAQHEQAIEAWLSSQYLGNTTAQAEFLPNIGIREGWLRLTPTSDSETSSPNA